VDAANQRRKSNKERSQELKGTKGRKPEVTLSKEMTFGRLKLQELHRLGQPTRANGYDPGEKSPRVALSQQKKQVENKKMKWLIGKGARDGGKRCAYVGGTRPLFEAKRRN